MRVEYKDYYKVLNVPRNATADEIRKAFRRLARQYHPDVAPNKEAAEIKFKEINEAYGIVGDPEKRRHYDALSTQMKKGDQFNVPFDWGANARTYGQQARRGQNFEFHYGTNGFSEFLRDFFRNGANAGSAKTKQGANRSTTNEPPRQESESTILVSLLEVLRGSVRPITLQHQTSCDACKGSGKISGYFCPSCSGNGFHLSTETRQVRIPSGIKEGQHLRIKSNGSIGKSDIYLRVCYAKHPDFRVEGSHLIHELVLAPWEAVLGSEVAVPTLERRTKIRIPAGATNGQRLRLHGYGLPSADGTRGDIYIALRVRMPETLDEKERTLWQELAKESNFQPRNRG